MFAMRGLAICTICAVIALLVQAWPTPAQTEPPLPADCPAEPNGPDTLSLGLFFGLPGILGVPGAGGAIGALGLDHLLAEGTLCTPAEPALPRDILRGDPAQDLLGNESGEGILAGPPAWDLLRGN
jgi:hypothetical protein